MSSILASFDQFTANSTLRLKQKPSSMNVWLGIISFLLMILFAVLLFSRIDATINAHESQITFSESQRKTDEGNSFDDIMFAIGFNSWMIPNISQYQNYFTMYVEYLSKDESVMKLELLKPCSPEKWKKLGSDYQTLYDKYLLNQTYCPENPINVNVVDITQDFLKIHFSDCIKSINPNCKSQKQVQQTVFNEVKKKYSSFYINMYFLVQSVEIHSSVPINYDIRQQIIKFDFTLDALNYSYLNIKKHIITDLQKYQIEIDNSRLSFYFEKSIVEGYMFGQFITKIQSYDRCSFPKQYLLLQYGYSQKIKTYTRTYNNVDDIISDTGGLVKIVMGIFGLFLGSFDQIRYQLTVAESSFNYNSDGKKVKRRDLNLWTYAKYYFYDLINIICYCEPKWTQTQKMAKTVKESNQFLDAKKFFRKLTYLERVVEENLSQNTIKSMSVTEPLSLIQVQEKRLLISYYETIINYQEAATVQDAIAQSSESFKYLKKSDSFLSSSLSRLNINPEIKHQELYQVQYKSIEKSMEQSFAKHLLLDLETCRSISRYPLIAEDAKKIQLTEEQAQMQIKMTTRFLQLSHAKKREVIKKIPIIIMHRLRMRAQSFQENQTDKEKGSTLKIKDQKKITPEKIINEIKDTFCEFDAFTAQPVLTNLIQHRPFNLIDIVNIVILSYLAYSLISQLKLITSLDSTRLKIMSYNKVEHDLNEVQDLMFAIKFQETFTQQFGGSLGLMSNFVWSIEYQPVENEPIKQLMVPCQPEMWSLLGNSTYRQFVQYKLDKAYCLKKSIPKIKPVLTHHFLKLRVSTCTYNSSNQTAVDPSTYDPSTTHLCQGNGTNFQSPNISFCNYDKLYPYYLNVTEQNRYFPVQIYNLVPQITPHNKNPINYNIKMSRFTVLTNKSGVFNQFLNPKRVITDSNIWPQVTTLETITKYVPTTVSQDRLNPLSQSKSGTLFQVYLYARSEILVYQRSIKTIDQVMSSLGGIFSVLVAVIAFVFGSFYQKRFGLNVCESAFNFDSDGNKFSDDQLTGFKHIKFILYSKFPCLKSFVSQKQQRQMKLMNQTFDEVDELLDIQKILQRLDFLERVIWKYEDLNYLSAMALIQHESIAQISHKRMVIEYYQQIIQQKAAASVQDAVNKSSNSFNYLKKNIKKDGKLTNQKFIEQSQVIEQMTEKQLKMKQIQLSLINDLNIKNEIAKAISEYPEISDQAQKIELTPQWDQIEAQITYGFLELDQQKKQKIMMKIPMIIIHRLRMKAKKFKMYSQLMVKNKINSDIGKQSIHESENESRSQMMQVRNII